MTRQDLTRLSEVYNMLDDAVYAVWALTRERTVGGPVPDLAQLESDLRDAREMVNRVIDAVEHEGQAGATAD